MESIKTVKDFWESISSEKDLHFGRAHDITLPKVLINLSRLNDTKVLPQGYVQESVSNLYDILASKNIISEYFVNHHEIKDKESFCRELEMLSNYRNFTLEEIHGVQYIRLSDAIFSRFFEDSVLDSEVLQVFRDLSIEKSLWYYKAPCAHKEYMPMNFNIFVRALILNSMFIRNVFTTDLDEITDLIMNLYSKEVLRRDILESFTTLQDTTLSDEEKSVNLRTEVFTKVLPAIEGSLYLRIRSNQKVVLSNAIMTRDEVKIFRESNPDCVHTDRTRFDLSLSSTITKYSTLSLAYPVLKEVIAYFAEGGEVIEPIPPILYEEAYQYNGEDLSAQTKTRAIIPDWILRAYSEGILHYKDDESNERVLYLSTVPESEGVIVNIGDYIILASYDNFTLYSCPEESFETRFVKKDIITHRDAPITTSWGNKEFVFLNGTPAVIEARTDGTAGALIKAGENEILVGENAYIFGGRHDDDTLTDTSITMNGGTVKNIFGGGLHKSHTHKAEIKVLGGTVKTGIQGGGAGALIKTCGCTFENDEYYSGPAEESPCVTDETSVYIRGVNAEVTKPSTLVYGGGEGISYVKKTSLDIDDAKVLYVTGGGSNGRTDEVIMSVGECASNTVIQGINRGSVGSVDMTVKSNAIGKVFAAAETPFVGTKENPNKNDPSGTVDNVKVSIYEGAQIEFTLGGNDYEVITEASPVYKNITVLENLTEAAE